MPLNAGQVIQLVCLVLGTISGLFQVQYGLSIYQDVVKPASRYSTALAAPNLAKLKQFLAGDGISESPIFAPITLNTAPDLSQNGHGTTNETALGFPEMVFQCPENALADRLNDGTTDEKTSCPFAQPEPLVLAPNVVSPFRLFAEILEEILTFLLYWFLNAELRIFAFWDQQMCLFAPMWVWEGELKARMMRCLDLLLALAPILSWSKYVAIVDELEKRLTTEHERTVQRIHDGHRLVIEAKDAEIKDLRQQLQDEDALMTWQIFAIYAENETEMQDKTRDHAMQVGETDGLLKEHLKTIETYREKFDGMLRETSDKSKRILDLEESHRRIQTQLNTYDQHLAKDGWKMTPIGLRPLAPPPGPPSSRIPAPQFRNNGPPFNPGAAQFIPRPAHFAPQPPHHQPGFRGPQVDPRFMGH